MSYDLKKVLTALGEFGPTLDKTNDEPNSGISLKTAGDDTPVTTQPSLRKVLSSEDRIYLQRSFMSLSQQELTHLFYLQLAKQGAGVPMSQWSVSSAALNEVAGNDPVIQNVLDTTNGGALIRQDLEPMLYSL